MEKTNINPACLQEVLDCAANAKQNGQSQFFTPLDLARTLAGALPQFRKTLVDLTCGAGHLLYGCANETTEHLLGMDIDPMRSRPKELEALKMDGTGRDGAAARPHIGAAQQRTPYQFTRITRDLTRGYTRLQEIDWQMDLAVLNPPWRLFFYRDRLDGLLESRAANVQDAYRGLEDGAPRGTIDSTIATYLIALDRLTTVGEGLLIANNNTLERLLFGPGAPHAAAARHCWARLVIPGNPMTGLNDCNWQPLRNVEPFRNDEARMTNDETQSSSFDIRHSEFHTGVIYFAREHTDGPETYEWPALPQRQYRLGAEVRDWTACQRTPELWSVAKEQIQIDADAGRSKSHYQLWLNVGGRIQVHLSRFDQASTKVDKNEAARLNKLQGKLPMQLVMQRADRKELMHCAGMSQDCRLPIADCGLGIGNPVIRQIGNPQSAIRNPRWRVDPALITAIEECLGQYHSARAPLYPLPDIQRLGYCDEVDFMECRNDLCLTAYSNFFCKECDYETLKPQGEECPKCRERLSLIADCRLRIADCGKSPAANPQSAISNRQSPKLIAVVHAVPAGLTAPLFGAGKTYPLRTQTVKVTRVAWKPNIIGQLEKLEYNGQELAMYLTAEDGWEYCFMEGNLRQGNTKVDVTKVVVAGNAESAIRNPQSAIRNPRSQHPTLTRPIDFTLQELVGHFIIPDVPDVASVNAEGYKRNLQMIDELEQLTEEMKAA